MIERVAEALIAEMGDVEDDPESLHLSQQLAPLMPMSPVELVPYAYRPGP
jgi:hypothetical protein